MTTLTPLLFVLRLIGLIIGYCWIYPASIRKQLLFSERVQGYELFLDNVKLANSFDYEYDEPHVGLSFSPHMAG